MKFDDYLDKIKIKLATSSLPLEFDEYDVKLNNHNPENKKIYRFHYISYYKSSTCKKICWNNWKCAPFVLPDKMEREEACKVLSYFADQVVKETNVDIDSLPLVMIIDSMIDSELFGFKHIDETVDDDVVDLFVISGRKLYFKDSCDYQKYFNWYIPHVNEDEIKGIYSRVEIDFVNPNFDINSNHDYPVLARKLAKNGVKY